MDPEVIVKTGTSYPSMHDVFYSKDKLQEIIENNWAVEIFWFPFNSLPFDLSNDELWVRTFNKVRTQETEKVVSHWFYKIKNAYDFISQETLRTVHSSEPVIGVPHSFNGFPSIPSNISYTQEERYMRNFQMLFISGGIHFLNKNTDACGYYFL